MSVEQRLERIEQKIDDMNQAQTELRVNTKGISTKMDLLLGPDGNNGIFGSISSRVKILEDRSAYTSGFFGAMGVAAGALFHWAVAKLLGWH